MARLDVFMLSLAPSQGRCVDKSTMGQAGLPATRSVSIALVSYPKGVGVGLALPVGQPRSVTQDDVAYLGRSMLKPYLSGLLTLAGTSDGNITGDKLEVKGYSEIAEVLLSPHG